MARSHTYSRSPAIFLYFLLFSTCCELLDLNTYLSKQASLRYAVCDPASSEAAESPPSNVSYLVDSRHLCSRFRRRRFFSARLSHTPTSISSFHPLNRRIIKRSYSTRITWSCPAYAATDRTFMSHLSSTAMDDSSPLGLVDLSFPAIQATEQHSDNSNTIPDDLVSDLPKKGLTICPLNIRHRSNKLDEIKLLLTSVASRRHGKPNLILGISESDEVIWKLKGSKPFGLNFNSPVRSHACFVLFTDLPPQMLLLRKDFVTDSETLPLSLSDHLPIFLSLNSRSNIFKQPGLPSCQTTWPPDWFTAEIGVTIKERNRLHKLASAHNNSSNWDAYRHARNKLR
ncbi:hypothetical protein P5673_028362 [Acropora cervicornis]|uniref:Endonuclease/exonuclease/phosphatase domain-containing protein n=1 Tax=Acropora cervicornis TaxID=6130 RepID=A0AAD9UV61_ACRCE|nr:hypothetical protein P5673_028362 [Acropora cervicornis]